MSRSKRAKSTKSGRSKSNTISRGRRNSSSLRSWLIIKLRRFGKVAALTVFVLWIGAWLWLSGTVQRSADSAKIAFYDITAEHGFAVEDIYIEGRVNADPDVLRAIINMERGDPILSFNPSEAKEMIDRISWIKDSHVERRLPNLIYVNLLERQPVALWQHKGKVKLIDIDGHVLTDRPTKAHKNLVIVVGDDKAKEALKQIIPLLDAEPIIAKQVDAMQYRSDRRWNVTMKNGIVVKLPEDNVAMSLALLASSQEDHDILGKDITTIDLRNPQKLTVRTRPGKTQDLHKLIGASAKDKAI